MSEKSQPTSREEWFSHVAQQEKSGLSSTEYCKQNNLIDCRFFYYRQLLRKPKMEREKSPSFTPITTTQSSAHVAEIRIELPNGFRCYIPNQINSSQLKQLIGILLSC